ncbi:MAG: hypothetical protein JO210_18455 [Acidobacteriaceae bacterium]|nr:hypothetical protein [Acidobacteriaceae bacterium]
MLAVAFLGAGLEDDLLVFRPLALFTEADFWAVFFAGDFVEAPRAEALGTALLLSPG